MDVHDARFGSFATVLSGTDGAGGGARAATAGRRKRTSQRRRRGHPAKKVIPARKGNGRLAEMHLLNVMPSGVAGTVRYDGARSFSRRRGGRSVIREHPRTTLASRCPHKRDYGVVDRGSPRRASASDWAGFAPGRFTDVGGAVTGRRSGMFHTVQKWLINCRSRRRCCGVSWRGDNTPWRRQYGVVPGGRFAQEPEVNHRLSVCCRAMVAQSTARR